MLAECRRLPAVRRVQGCAEAIPLRNNSVDLVWMFQVFHHLDCPKGVLAEVRRVLASAGTLAVRNGTRESEREVL
jgi:ubiquinone/menaquinone biosynthesis C-methylase UbiE